MATEDTPVQPPSLRKTSFEGHWEERDTPRPHAINQAGRLLSRMTSTTHDYATSTGSPPTAPGARTGSRAWASPRVLTTPTRTTS